MVLVAFNKVCTAQYFVWWLALLPLVLPSSELLLRANWPRATALGGLWLGGMALWLGCAYELEFNGRACFLQVWGAGLAFLGANVAALCALIGWHRPTPLFRRGRVCSQALSATVGEALRAPAWCR